MENNPNMCDFFDEKSNILIVIRSQSYASITIFEIQIRQHQQIRMNPPVSLEPEFERICWVMTMKSDIRIRASQGGRNQHVCYSGNSYAINKFATQGTLLYHYREAEVKHSTIRSKKIILGKSLRCNVLPNIHYRISDLRLTHLIKFVYRKSDSNVNQIFPEKSLSTSYGSQNAYISC